MAVRIEKVKEVDLSLSFERIVVENRKSTDSGQRMTGAAAVWHRMARHMAVIFFFCDSARILSFLFCFCHTLIALAYRCDVSIADQKFVYFGNLLSLEQYTEHISIRRTRGIYSESRVCILMHFTKKHWYIDDKLPRLITLERVRIPGSLLIERWGQATPLE